MARVDATAQIEREVRLDDAASVGPWCELRGAVSVGARTELMHRAVVAGTVAIEEAVRIYPGARIGGVVVDTAAGNGRPVIVIERRAIIREGVTIDSGTTDRPTRIGADVYLMVNTRVGAGATVGATATIANGVELGEGSSVGERVTIGGNSIVGAGVRIGRMAMVSGMVRLSHDVPPFCTAYRDDSVGSLNLIGLRRAGLRDRIDGLKGAFDLLFRSGLGTVEAVGRIRGDAGLMSNPVCEELAEFAEESRLGIVRYGGTVEKEPD